MTDVTYSSNGMQKLLLVSTSDKKDVNRAVKIATKDGKVVGKAKLTVSSMKSSKSEISINVTSVKSLHEHIVKHARHGHCTKKVFRRNFKNCEGNNYFG